MVELRPSEYEELLTVLSDKQLDRLMFSSSDTLNFWWNVDRRLGKKRAAALKTAALQRRAHTADLLELARTNGV